MGDVDKDACRAAYRSVPRVRMGAGATYAGFEEGWRHGRLDLEAALRELIACCDKIDESGRERNAVVYWEALTAARSALPEDGKE